MNYLKIYTADELKQVERHGYNFQSIRSLAVYLQVDFYDIVAQINNQNSEVHAAFYRGFCLREEEIMSAALKTTAETVLCDKEKTYLLKKYKSTLVIELYE